MYSLGVIRKKLTSPSRSAKDTSAIAEMKLDIQRLIQVEHDAKKKEVALVSNPPETNTSRDIAKDLLSQDQSSTARELPLFPTMNAMVHTGTGSRGLDSVPNQAAVPRDMPAPNSAPEDTVLEYLSKCAEAAARLTADIEEAIGKWNGSREYQPGCLSPAFQITSNAMDRLWTYENKHVSATAPPPPYAPLRSTSRRPRSVIYHELVSEQEWDELPRRAPTAAKRYQVPESSTIRPDEKHVRTEKIIIRREHSAHDEFGLPLGTARERSVVSDRWNQSPPNQHSLGSSPRVRDFRFEREAERSGLHDSVAYDAEAYYHAAAADAQATYQQQDQQGSQLQLPPPPTAPSILSDVTVGDPEDSMPSFGMSLEFSYPDSLEVPENFDFDSFLKADGDGRGDDASHEGSMQQSPARGAQRTNTTDRHPQSRTCPGPPLSRKINLTISKSRRMIRLSFRVKCKKLLRRETCSSKSKMLLPLSTNHLTVLLIEETILQVYIRMAISWPTSRQTLLRSSIVVIAMPKQDKALQ